MVLSSEFGKLWFIAPMLALLTSGCALLDFKNGALPQSGLVQSEFIYQEAPFPECHASTIVETPYGLLAAWFGGTEERNADVEIWISENENGVWTEPRSVANGIQHDQKRYPCWNPVLYQIPNGPVQLYYKVGPTPREWWGMLTESEDGGRTWSFPRRLPEDILGPIKNKPIPLTDGTLLCPSSSEQDGWRVHFEITPDHGRTWSLVGPVHDGQTYSAIQPTVFTQSDGSLLALCRSRQGRIVQVTSQDNGRAWSPMTATSLPNPNAGFDGVTLRDGRLLLVYNHTPRGRSPLNVALSDDDGRTWQSALILENEPGEYSYPAVIQSADGRVHITYTWKRETIKHVVLDPNRLELRPL